MFRGLSLLHQIRTKTYVMRPSKQKKKFLRVVDKLKAEGKPIPYRPRGIKETKFFYVEGNLKIYKPLTNGLRHRRHLTRFHLTNKPAQPHLSFGKRSKGGRNCTGRITVRHQGGGHKKRYLILFNNYIYLVESE